MNIPTPMSGKRPGMYFGGAVLIYLVVIYVLKPMLPPSVQAVHMKQVREHIVKIIPAWESFKSTNGGFELVKFGVYTGGDGQFAISGYLTSTVQRTTLLRFIAETSPPRDIHTNGLQVVAPDLFPVTLESESSHAANRSGLARPLTNSTSAAGSGNNR
jgi:hypothetical protein